MIEVSKQWNPKQARLKEVILKKDMFCEAVELALEMHALVHTSEMSGINGDTYEDEVWKGLSHEIFRAQFKNQGSTIAWNLWHLTRIEDITVNLLLADQAQIINTDSWLEKLKVSVCDTGNAMDDNEISVFSSLIDMQELRNYRIAVGRQTQRLLKSLKPDDMKRKVKSQSIQRVLQEGGVTEQEQSIWLLDFWGKKTVAGIILMPVTRHQIVHLNDCLKLKTRMAAPK